MKQVAVIGLGNMGMGMARNLVTKGFKVNGYARRAELKSECRGFGATASGSAAEATAGSDVVMLMVMNGEQVLEVIGEIKSKLKRGAAVVIGATIGRACVKQAEALLAGTAVELVDMPVSGGKGGADAGTLTLMIATKKSVFDANRDVLEAIGANLYFIGEEPGLGQVVKSCLQVVVGATFEALFEAMVLGAKAGLDPAVLGAVINTSFVGSKLSQYVTPLIVERRFANSGSHIGTMQKDLGISMNLARDLGVPMPMASVVAQMFQAGINCYPDGDNWAIVQLLEKLADTEVRPK